MTSIPAPGTPLNPSPQAVTARTIAATRAIEVTIEPAGMAARLQRLELDQAEAVTLMAELAAEILERHDPGVIVGRALGDLLEATAEALYRRARGEPDTPDDLVDGPDVDELERATDEAVAAREYEAGRESSVLGYAEELAA
jgi:hypothetical protein